MSLTPTFLAFLQVIHTEGSKRVMNDCDQVGRWRRFVHAQYLNCLTFDLFEVYRDHVRTIELFVYLDDVMNKTSCIDCFSAEIKSQLSGAVVVVHNADTYPDINQEGINLQPGSLTEIKVKTIKHTQKTPPYGRCSPDTPITIKLYGTETYAYSEHACRMSTIQSQINDLCGCNAIEYPYLNGSLPFCLALNSFVHVGECEESNEIDSNSHSYEQSSAEASQWNWTESETLSKSTNFTISRCLAELETVKNHVACKSEVTTHFQGDVVPSCTLPCAFFSYETDRSTSTWPTKAWQLSWLGTKAGQKILNRPDLAEYRRARELLNSPDGEATAQEILTRSDVLERNLLAIMIIRPNFNLHNVEEKEVLSLTSLLSQSGGLFSIWIGLNMMSVIEVLELLVHLFNTCKTIQTSTSVDDDGEQHTDIQSGSVAKCDLTEPDGMLDHVDNTLEMQPGNGHPRSSNGPCPQINEPVCLMRMPSYKS
ncbi:hypothetical protein P879_04698 [Paragonimus westermani]|uniref:FMRFamide-activated amiloride-sensitive sodium channel n=1 Tax=Paragonimus westermani TaxID=34504 RepID=A0A8T0D6R4_9TREM|nr:hypothetical protein P879_04698 [Paragonimus westermani]